MPCPRAWRTALGGLKTTCHTLEVTSAPSDDGTLFWRLSGRLLCFLWGPLQSPGMGTP